MKRASRIVLTVGCLLIIIVSWIIVLAAKSNSEKQANLLALASEYLEDEIYIYAAPLLEEAAALNAAYTYQVETALKDVYLHLIDQGGYRRKYLSLLEKQMNRREALPEVFMEAANFYLEGSKIADACAVLRAGIAKTGSEELITLYENNRYEYRMGYETYEDVTEIYGTTIGVKREGLWGMAYSDGTLQIPCQYEKISTYSAGRVIVQKNGVIYAVDDLNNRLALLKKGAADFGNFTDDRVSVLTNQGWQRASGDFTIGSMVFERIGAYSGGYAAAKQNGKWGVIDRSTAWLIPAVYDRVIMDELGRSYAQGSVFVKKGDSVYLFVDGKQAEGAYEDAKPFGEQGYAAVKKNGKWGFINTAAEVIIDYQFEDARSFSQHLAAVKESEFWGYINLSGKIVIEPIFLEAKSFGEGNAPVLTERGWQFISLLEYRKGVSL